MSAENLPAEPRPVLLVEDDPVYRNSLARLLRHDGHEVMTAKDTDEALELLRNDLLLSPWVIVTDLEMPGRRGEELLATLRRTDEWKHIPVVVITGVPPSDRRSVASDALLVKPVTHQQLHETLTALAARHRQPLPRATGVG